MKIDITCTAYEDELPRFVADAVELPGTPTVGVGITQEAAISNLFLYLLRNPDMQKLLDFTKIEII